MTIKPLLAAALLGLVYSPIALAKPTAAQQSPAATQRAIVTIEEPLYANYVFEVENKSVQRMLNDQVNVRKQPSLQSDIADTLAIGQEVTIVSKSKQVFKSGNRAANWYQVRYSHAGKERVGYVWGANFSIGYQKLRGYEFLLGVAPAKEDGEVTMVVNVVKEGKLKQQVHFETTQESLSSVRLQWLSNKGLTGIKNILFAEVSGEACGVPTMQQYMLWDGEKLIAMPTLMTVGDAGIYYHTEDYIFPTDKQGKPNQITMMLEEGEEDGVEGSGNIKITQKEKTVYLWKNGKVIKQ